MQETEKTSSADEISANAEKETARQIGGSEQSILGLEKP
jgi:hypothetical protein